MFACLVVGADTNQCDAWWVGRGHLMAYFISPKSAEAFVVLQNEVEGGRFTLVSRLSSGLSAVRAAILRPPAMAARSGQPLSGGYLVMRQLSNSRLSPHPALLIDLG
jgi:hypothetical protein